MTHLSINYLCLEFTLQARQRLKFEHHIAGAIHGSFGNALKMVAGAGCRYDEDCSACIDRRDCLYSYIFETPALPDDKVMKNYQKKPHPYFFNIPINTKQEYSPGEKITHSLTLIGTKAIKNTPRIILALKKLEEIGIGKDRGKVMLQSVRKISHNRREKEDRLLHEDADGIVIYSANSKNLSHLEESNLSLDLENLQKENGMHGTLSISFLTPTTLMNHRVLTKNLEFQNLITNILRRMTLLASLHCGANTNSSLVKDAIKAARRRAEEVKVVGNNLEWHDWQRYSKRDNTTKKEKGFVGNISFHGPITPFLPLIRAGEILHVGKKTSFGHGKYSYLVS